MLYKNQGKYGNTVKVATELSGSERETIARHKIVDKQDHLLCLVETWWESGK